MTVGDLINMLSDFDEDMPVYLGHDKWSIGDYYTFGGINYNNFEEIEDEDEDE